MSRQMLHLQVMQIRMRCAILWSCCRKAARHVCHAITAQKMLLTACWLTPAATTVNGKVTQQTNGKCTMVHLPFACWVTTLYSSQPACSYKPAPVLYKPVTVLCKPVTVLYMPVYCGHLFPQAPTWLVKQNIFLIIQENAFLQADLKSLIISRIDCEPSQIISNHLKRLISDYHLMYWLTIRFCSACPTA